MNSEWTPKTINDLCCYWLVSYARAFKAPSSYKRDQGIVKHYISPAFGERKLCSVKARELEIWLQSLRLRSGLSEKTSNDVLGLLRKIFADGHRWGFVDDNPVTWVKKFRIFEQPYQYWKEDEITMLLDYTRSVIEPPRIWWPTGLALYTGLRRGELVALKWKNIDLENRLIAVCESYCRILHADKSYTKSGKVRHVPISHSLVYFLEKLRMSPYSSNIKALCNIHIDRFQPELAKLALVVGLPRIKFHDLRHTFASAFVTRGGNIYDLQKILGHSTIQVTERYAHLSPERLRGKTDILNF